MIFNKSRQARKASRRTRSRGQGHRSGLTPATSLPTETDPPQAAWPPPSGHTSSLQLAAPDEQHLPTGVTITNKPRSRKKCCTSPFARCRQIRRCPSFRSAPGPPWSDPCDTTGWPLPPCRCSNDATPNHQPPHRVVRRDGCGSRARALHNWAPDQITLIKHQRRQSPEGSAPRLAADPLERCRSVAARGAPSKWHVASSSAGQVLTGATLPTLVANTTS